MRFVRRNKLRGLPTAAVISLAVAAAALFPGSAAHCEAARPDSTTGAAGLAASDWLPHGSYQTDYDVNRTVHTWSQTFNTPYSIGKLRLNTNVGYTYSTDATNNRKTVNRTARTSINYLPIGGLKLGMSFDVTRNNMETPTVDTRSKTNREKVLVTGEYTFSPLSNMSTTVSGQTGGIDELLENRTIDRSGRGRSSSLDLKNSYKPYEFLTWSANLGGDFTSLNSEDSQTALATKDRNVNETYDTSLDLRPGGRWGATLSLRRLESQFQYPKEDAQETKLGYSNGGDLRLSVKPLATLSLDLTASSEHKVIDFAVERVRSTVTEVKSFGGTMRYELLGGTKLESRINWEDQRSEYGSGPDIPISVESQAGYLYVRSLDGSVSRSLGKKLEARASGNISLRSYQFDDTENNPDDRDMLNHTMNLDLTYSPSKKYTAGLGLSKRVDNLVYISPKKSSNNRDGETYTVSADFTFRMSPTTSISQNARMSADYSFYEFSESKNFLIRNTTLHTVFRTRVLKKIGLVVLHDYRYQDQGGVEREGGTVFYGRTGDNDRQDMTITMDYEPVSGVKLALSQRFQDDKRFSISNDERTLISETDRVELMGKMQVKYKIANNTDVDGSFERMDSSVEGEYWRVAATFKRNF